MSGPLGHGDPVFTIDTYQHVLPGMQADAAQMIESPDRPGDFYRLRPVEHPVERNKRPAPLRRKTSAHVGMPRVFFVVVLPNVRLT